MGNRVLITPLNWGLGHATRCMPVIDTFRNTGAEVILASDGEALAFLEKEYPNLPCHALPGYRIAYPRHGSMALKMLWSTPRILAAIREEHRAVQQLVKSEKADILFSDNRYGCYSDAAYSVILTHQVNIQCPTHLRWLQPGLDAINARRLARFDALWIPDMPDAPNLSGALSHPAPHDAVYVGPLSRFRQENAPGETAPSNDILVVCTGPEPQRSLFEDLARNALRHAGRKATLVRGIVDGQEQSGREGDLTVINWLPSTRMEAYMRAASLVLSRPGYSTVMDLARLGKKAVFIPTPGQTEQEYLAAYYNRQGIFYSEHQHAFDLERALSAAEGYSGLQVAGGHVLLGKAVHALLGGLRN